MYNNQILTLELSAYFPFEIYAFLCIIHLDLMDLMLYNAHYIEYFPVVGK